MATTEQKKKLLKAKIAVALHDEQFEGRFSPIADSTDSAWDGRFNSESVASMPHNQLE